MKIKIETDPARIRVTVPGHSWVNGIKAPEIEGWEPYWVSHFGSERTEYTYRPKGSSNAAPVVQHVEPQSIAARHEEIVGEDDNDRAYERSVDA
jgi:hypothetical protein